MAETVQTDAQGRRYIDYPGQGRVYISPVAFGGDAPADPGPWKNRAWNPRTGQWETKIDWTLPATLAVGGVMAAPAIAAAAGTAGAAGAAGTAAKTTAVASGAAKVGLGSTLLRYGLQYGVPIAGQLIGGKMAANAERDSNAALMGYYDKALAAEKEDRDYRRGFDEEGRRYDREFGEEGRRYGRYSDQYGRESGEEDRAYGRAGDTYGRLSDEEKLAYDRSQSIRDKNYGYQQYGNFVETLEPYRAGGSAAASRMSGLMGGPRTPDTGSYLNLAKTARDSVQAVPSVPDRPTWSYSGTRPTWNYPEQPVGAGQTPAAAGAAPVSTTQPVGGGTPLVLVEAPDGSRRELPEADAARAVAMGGRRLT